MKTMKAKKITSVLCALALAVSVAVTTSAQQADNGSITSAKTPASSTSVTQKWANKYASSSPWGDTNSCGTPLAVGNYLYVTDSSSNKLLKLDAKTGAAVKSAAYANIPPYFSMLAYGDGKIYVPQQTATSVQISAFDADTLNLVWQSAAITSAAGNLQIGAPITYYNRHIYLGTYVQDSSWNYIAGKFACLNTADGTSVWQYDNANAGYYSAGSTIAGNAIVFGDTAGNLSSLDLLSGAVKDTVALGSSIYSTPCFSNGKAYVSLKDGNLVSVPLKSDSTFYSTAKMTVKLGNSITSSPVVYNGRVYVAGGGYGSTSPFSVLDANTLHIIYQINGIHSQSTPLISTAYATADNHQQVYLYVTNYFSGAEDWSSFNADSSCTYLIKDSIGQTTASYEKLANVSVPQSCTQSVTASDAGWLYYYNDSGNLFAFAPVTETKPASSTPVIPVNTPASAPATSTSSAAHNAPTGGSSSAVLLFGAAALSVAVFCATKKKHS